MTKAAPKGSRLHTEERVIRTSWWTCDNPDHRHKTQGVADACIAESRKAKRLQTEWTPALKRRLFTLVINGASLAEAGRSVGAVSKTRAQQVVRGLLRQMLHHSRMDEVVPDHDWFALDEMRLHSEFWLRRLDRMLPPEVQE